MPFPQLCQHKCRCGCSPSLKITWQKPNHHLCLLLSPGSASTPTQREVMPTAAPADVRGWVHGGTQQGWGEGRGGSTVNQYLLPKVKYLPMWNYSLSILCLQLTIRFFLMPKWRKGALVHDLFWHQAPTKVKGSHQSLPVDQGPLWRRMRVAVSKAMYWVAFSPTRMMSRGEGRVSCSASE